MTLGVKKKKNFGDGAQVKEDVNVLKSTATAEVGAEYAGYKVESEIVDTKVEISDEEVGFLLDLVSICCHTLLKLVFMKQTLGSRLLKQECRGS